MARVMSRHVVLLTVLALASATACAHEPVAPLEVLGRWHEVEQGDTVAAVADQYGADPEALAELNDLPLEGPIRGRERVFVPKSGGKAPGIGADPPKPLKVASAPPPSVGASKPGDGRCDGAKGPCLAWPVDGEVGAGFDPKSEKPHDGIDIPAARGTPVEAAAAGTVLYSGAEIKGYGNLLIIRHKGGIITVYAHNDENLVSEGDEVESGRQVAAVGDSGTAETTHLHFEVRVDERPRDPLLYLSPKEGP
jgi:lipoprotein NlpD